MKKLPCGCNDGDHDTDDGYEPCEGFDCCDDCEIELSKDDLNYVPDGMDATKLCNDCLKIKGNNMGKHTPGLVYDMANQTLHNVSADRYSIFFVAPELLEALKRLSFSVSLEAEDYPDMQLFRQVKAAVIKAKKVIAKAEGTA